MKNPLKYRSDIDGLRGIAVLLVIVFHYYPSLCPNGYIGVDIFFVISGYLITNIIIDGVGLSKFSLINFYGRRIRRIFPALFLVLIFSIITGWCILLPSQYKELGKEIAAGTSFFSNYYFLETENYFNQNSLSRILLPLWSLSIEEQFYLVYPFVIFGCRLFKIQYLAAFMLIFSASFLFNLHYILAAPMVSFFSPFSRVWEFLAGGILAIMPFDLFKNKFWIFQLKPLWASKNILIFRFVPEFLSILGFVLILLSLFVTHKEVFPGWYALLPTAGTLLLLLDSGNSFIGNIVLRNPILLGMGLISYPLYLWHWPILSLYSAYESGNVSNIDRLLLLGISLLLAFITYFLVERPLKKLNIKTTKNLTFTLVGGMAIVGLFGFILSRFDGFPNRFPLYIQELSIFGNPADIEGDWGVKGCFLHLPTQSYRDFSECNKLRGSNVGYKPTLLVWGDSHAAHLIPGLEKSYGDKFNIVLRSAASCAPVLEDISNNNPCNNLNYQIFDELSRLKPSLILLSGRWKDVQSKSIDTSFELLRKKIQPFGGSLVVVAPPPRWEGNLPDQLMRWGINNRSNFISDLPGRKFEGLSAYYPDEKFEMHLKDLVGKNGAQFISLTDILCSLDGCLTRVGDKAEDIVAIDYDHFSVVGSHYVSSKFQLPLPTKDRHFK